MATFSHTALDLNNMEVDVGHISAGAATVNLTIEHVVCYIARGSDKGSYPKYTACGLPGHTMEKCFPLIILCIAHVPVSDHPNLGKHIKATYK
jgi:hypothetical protein